VNELERLTELPDPQVLAWLTGGADVPAEFDTPLLRRLREFRGSGGEQA
jgi:succinate dehydrogenase flavin-adding protein (antitoxin of CptAB toxin-antitoxin module)